MAHGGKRQGAGRPKGQGKFGETTRAVRLPQSMLPAIMKFIENKGYTLPLYGSKVPAGSPASADDYLEKTVDLNQLLIDQPTSTFLVRATGQSMLHAGIHENDILIVERSIKATHGKIVIAAIDGELTVKRLHQKDNQLILMPENPNFKPIVLNEESNLYIWGVVTYVLHKL